MKRAISLITLLSFALSILTLNVNYVFATWDGTSVAMSYARGTGTESDPYVITKPEQLALLAQKVNGGESYNGCFFELGANIDLGGKEWTPIGTKSKPFKASFDGKGFSVGAFMITEDSFEYAAFIGYADGEDAVIKNFVIETAIIKSSKTYASGFIGYSSVKELKSITVLPDVIVKGHKTVGGVVGYLHQSDATYLVNYATLVGIGDESTPAGRIGGIAGYITSSCTISYYANHGHISGYGRSMGGIVGYASDMNGDATIESCYNTASIESINIAKASYVGGIVGYVNQFYETIFLCNNCYNLSDDITAAVNEAAVGSIFGYSIPAEVVSSAVIRSMFPDLTASTVAESLDRQCCCCLSLKKRMIF